MKSLLTFLWVSIIFVAAMTRAAEPPAMAATAPPVTVAGDYRISPGDNLQVFVWQNPELTVGVPVRPDGKISTPLVEDMVAVGKTPSNLARDIEKVLSQYIRSPQVNIIVTQPQSIFSQVKVIGEVGKEQSIPFREGLTVLDVLLQVGGLGNFAAGNRAYILRSENGEQKKVPVRLKDLLKGDMKQNLLLRAGDILIVPPSRF